MRSVLLLLGSALLLAACAEGAAPDGPAAPPGEGPPPGNPPMGGPDYLAGRPGLPLADVLNESTDAHALRERLHEPLRVEAEAFPNRHVPGQIDTVRTLVYDGLALEFYEVTGGLTFLQQVEVTGEGYETADALGVGSTRAEVEAVYPHSTAAEGSTVTYEQASGPDDPTPTALAVRYDGDRVAAMTWRYYVD